MNYLLAKKKRTENTFFKILSQQEQIYELDDLDNLIDYRADYKLEDEEWFCIREFNTTEYSTINLLKQENFNSVEYHQIPNNEYQNVKYFCAYQDNDNFCFQRFTYRNIIKQRWFSISGEPIIKTDQPIIILNNIPDAIYRKSADILYFRNLTDVKYIFPNMINLYKEATDSETEFFLNNSFILLSNGFSKDKVNTSNRKRITLAMETLSNLRDDDKHRIYDYIKIYCPELDFSDENEQFTIGNEEELKKLLFGIEQRYYTTNVGDEKRLANSIMKLQ
jgi:hypothetical protein